MSNMPMIVQTRTTTNCGRGAARLRWVFEQRAKLTIVAGALAILSGVYWAGAAALPGPIALWCFLGGYLVVAGSAIRFWASLYIGGRKNRELVTDGPYRLLRNPLYAGNLVASLGLGLVTGSPAVVVIAMPLLSAIWWCTVLAEEVRLEEKFGDLYRDYVGRVPRFIPRWVDLRAFSADTATKTVTHRHVPRELARASIVLALAVVIVGNRLVLAS